MTTETKDRHINTDAKIKDDGVKRLPHERDESPEGREAQPREIMKQAAKDLAEGQVDTDLRGERGVEASITPQPPGSKP